MKKTPSSQKKNPETAEFIELNQRKRIPEAETANLKQTQKKFMPQKDELTVNPGKGFFKSSNQIIKSPKIEGTQHPVSAKERWIRA